MGPKLKVQQELAALIQAAAKTVGDGGALGGLSGCAFSLVVAARKSATRGRLLVITPGLDVAEQIQLDLDALLPGTATLVAPVLDSQSPDKPAAWNAILARIQSTSEAIVLAPAATLLDALPAPRAIEASSISLRPGETLKLEPLFARLVESGLERVEQVEGPGQFARRGGIVDIYASTQLHPVRLELFGDRIESVRSFEPDTQRSFEALAEGFSFPLLKPGNDETATLTEYLSGASTVVCEPALCLERINTHASFSDDPAERPRAAAARGILAGAELRLTHEVLERNLECTAPVNLGDGYEGVGTLLKAFGQAGLTCLLFCGTEAEQRPARQGLIGQGVHEGPGLVLLPGDVDGGRVFKALGYAILSLHQLLGRQRRRQRFEEAAEPKLMQDVMDDFVELEAGDYVVHLQHGVARFRGMENLQRDGRSGEFLSLEFDEGVILHVPASSADVVQKYIGMRGVAPKLSRFNTAAWSERKLRAQQAVLKLAADMLEVQALRAQEAGHSCKKDGPEMADFEAAFGFTDTPDQVTSAAAIKRDMESRKPMDRLLCGDVGYGKTELAMRAAFKMVAEGRQAAVLVPTTVLAQQHFLSFSDRMKQFAINVDLLSRFRSPLQHRKTIEALAEGRVDIVIGTHRLLSADVQFKDLGLLVIDEEQRFGVEHKERLKHLRRTVDLLTLSATPIPRTLHQALLGLRDISNLTTPPALRHAVITRLMHWNDRELQDAIRRELNRDGQVFFVHNRVMDIEQVRDRVQSLVPEARIEVGHGQMNENELEEVMLRFMNREIDVLVSTTIIESGIDVRSANTIIIHDAHRHGLADLHQLRGRVGRHIHQAWCYLLIPDDVSLSDVAAKRLKAILQYQSLGSGFKIAMRDLELRGAGNLLGAEQSGHIASIGYDLYCRMLDRAVRKLKHQEVAPDVDTQLDLGLDVQIPRKYVDSSKHRLELYRRMARIRDDAQMEALHRELSDRFGKPPREVELLLTSALTRNRLARLGIIAVSRGEGHLKLRALSAPRAQKQLALVSQSFRVLDETNLALPLRKGLEQPADQMRFLSNLMSALAAKKGFGDEAPPKT